MNALKLTACVANRTSNVKLSRRLLANYVKEPVLKCVPHVLHDNFFLVEPIKSLIRRVFVAVHVVIS